MANLNESPSPTPSRHQSQDRVTHLEHQLKRTRLIAVIAAVVAVFLGIAVIAQQLNGTDSAPGNQAAPAAASASPTAAEGENTPDDSTTEPADTNENTGAGTGEDIDNNTTDNSSNQQPDVMRNDPQDPLAIGSIDAPVTMMEWVDYRCPFCALYANDTLPSIVQKYVDEGLLRIEFTDVAFFGEDSVNAAVAAHAAGEQGKYFEFMQALYAAAPESGHPDMPREKLLGFAKTAGVADLAAFEKRLDDQELADSVDMRTITAQQMGVTSVPFFLVGDTAFSGAQPLEIFEKVLTEEIEKAQAS